MKQLVSIIAILALLFVGGQALAQQGPNVYIKSIAFTSSLAGGQSVVAHAFTALRYHAGAGYYTAFGTQGVAIYLLNPSVATDQSCTLTIQNSPNNSDWFSPYTFAATSVSAGASISKFFAGNAADGFAPFWRVSRHVISKGAGGGISYFMKFVFFNN